MANVQSNYVIMTVLSDRNWASLVCIIMIFSLWWKVMKGGTWVFQITSECNSYDPQPGEKKVSETPLSFCYRFCFPKPKHPSIPS